MIPEDALRSDAKFNQEGGNGRKIAVQSIYPESERHARSPNWEPGDVIETGVGGYEMARFNEYAGQDLHQHEFATEIYTVLSGEMGILVGDDGKHVSVLQGDTIIVPPGTWHQVLRTTCFSAQVIVIDSTGPKDKFIRIGEKGQHEVRYVDYIDIPKAKAEAAKEAAAKGEEYEDPDPLGPIFNWPIPDSAKIPGNRESD